MRFTEEELRKMTMVAIEELGEKASPELVKKILSKTISSMDPKKSTGKVSDSGRVILTAFGMNKPGIIAAISAEIGKCNCDIHDMSQKLMDNFFTLIMILDITTSRHDFKHIQDRMNSVAEELNLKIYIQHEDIFKSMHRI